MDPICSHFEVEGLHWLARERRLSLLTLHIPFIFIYFAVFYSRYWHHCPRRHEWMSHNDWSEIEKWGITCKLMLFAIQTNWQVSQTHSSELKDITRDLETTIGYLIRSAFAECERWPGGKTLRSGRFVSIQQLQSQLEQSPATQHLDERQQIGERENQLHIAKSVYTRINVTKKQLDASNSI